MRIVRKLFLLAAAIAAAMALSTSAASAQSVEVVNELNGLHCGAVTAVDHRPEGGCHGNVSSNAIDLRGHVFGVESEPLTDCGNSFELRVNEDGAGFVSDMNITPGAGGNLDCLKVRNCNSESGGETHPGTNGGAPGNHGWPMLLTEPGAAAVMNARITVCFITGQAIPECEGALDVSVVETNENLLTATASDASIPAGASTFSTHCEVNGSWSITEEPNEDVHINHI